MPNHEPPHSNTFNFISVHYIYQTNYFIFNRNSFQTESSNGTFQNDSTVESNSSTTVEIIG